MEQNYILPFLWMKGESREIISEELDKIADCGIRAVCLESRPHPDFMGEGWWKDMEFILKQAKQRDMKIWILDDAHFPTGYANGLIKTKYPNRRKRYLNYNVVNVWGKQGEVSVNVKRMTKPLISFLELDKPMDMEERAKNKLIAVTAYPLRGESRLDEDGAIDLTDQVQGDYLTCRLPKENYRIFVVYETCTDGGHEDYINMMDKESVSTLIEAVYEPHYEHFAEEFGDTIAGFFSDEPEIGNMGGFLSNTQIGNSKMPLPWSEALRERMEQAYGVYWRKQLAYLWTETEQMKECTRVRHYFMDCVTQLYMENFSMQLGEWCRARNVEYIGHVVEDDGLHQRLGNGTGHYFRAMEGQHMAGIDVIGDQVAIGDRGYTRSGVFERGGAFFHYGLAKLGASAGHLDPKKQGRTMCELFGASGWQTGVRDMKYILDHLLVRGVNYLVPHAFSMAEYPDPDCPPHFYARGCNPQFSYFADLMKYANRMCHKLSGGRHQAAAALLYPAESEWGGRSMLLQEPARILQEKQIEFDLISADMLGDLPSYGGKVMEKSFMVNGQEFTHLVVPQAECLTFKAYEFIRSNPQISVIFLENKPARVVGGAADKGELDSALSHGRIVPLKDIGNTLFEERVQGVCLEREFPELVYYHYEKEEEIHLFHNESAFDTFRGRICIPIQHGAVYYDGMKDTYYRVPYEKQNGETYLELELAPYGMGMIIDRKDEGYPVYEMWSDQKVCLKQQSLEGAWRYATASAKEYPEFSGWETMEQLTPVSDLMPEFSGHICYEKEVFLPEGKGRTYVEFTEAYEAVELRINEVTVGRTLHPPYVFEITDYVKPGINRMQAVVTTTLDRDQVNYPEPFIILDFNVSEPTGLCGEVMLYFETNE